MMFRFWNMDAGKLDSTFDLTVAAAAFIRINCTHVTMGSPELPPSMRVSSKASATGQSLRSVALPCSFPREQRATQKQR